MELEDQKRQERMDRALERMDVDFKVQEAYFLNNEQRGQRLDSYKMKIKWQEHDLQAESDPQVRRDIESRIADLRSLYQLIVDCQLHQHSAPHVRKKFYSEKRKAYKSAQIMNLGIKTVERTIVKLHERPEDLQVIHDISTRYLSSRESQRMIQEEIMHLCNQFNYWQRINFQGIRLGAKEWIQKLLLDERY